MDLAAEREGTNENTWSFHTPTDSLLTASKSITYDTCQRWSAYPSVGTHQSTRSGAVPFSSRISDLGFFYLLHCCHDRSDELLRTELSHHRCTGCRITHWSHYSTTGTSVRRWYCQNGCPLWLCDTGGPHLHA